MFFSLSVIIGSSITLVVGIFGGYIIGNRNREHREIEENYDNLFTYILDNTESDDD